MDELKIGNGEPIPKFDDPAPTEVLLELGDADLRELAPPPIDADAELGFDSDLVGADGQPIGPAQESRLSAVWRRVRLPVAAVALSAASFALGANAFGGSSSHETCPPAAIGAATGSANCAKPRLPTTTLAPPETTTTLPPVHNTTPLSELAPEPTMAELAKLPTKIELVAGDYDELHNTYASINNAPTANEAKRIFSEAVQAHDIAVKFDYNPYTHSAVENVDPDMSDSAYSQSLATLYLALADKPTALLRPIKTIATAQDRIVWPGNPDQLIRSGLHVLDEDEGSDGLTLFVDLRDYPYVYDIDAKRTAVLRELIAAQLMAGLPTEAYDLLRDEQPFDYIEANVLVNEHPPAEEQRQLVSGLLEACNADLLRDFIDTYMLTVKEGFLPESSNETFQYLRKKQLRVAQDIFEFTWLDAAEYARYVKAFNDNSPQMVAALSKLGVYDQLSPTAELPGNYDETVQPGYGYVRKSYIFTAEVTGGARQIFVLRESKDYEKEPTEDNPKPTVYSLNLYLDGAVEEKGAKDTQAYKDLLELGLKVMDQIVPNNGYNGIKAEENYEQGAGVTGLYLETANPAPNDAQLNSDLVLATISDGVLVAGS